MMTHSSINAPKSDGFSLHKAIESVLFYKGTKRVVKLHIAKYFTKSFGFNISTSLINSLRVLIPKVHKPPQGGTPYFNYFYPKHKACIFPQHREALECLKCGDEITVYRHTSRSQGVSVRYSTYHPQPTTHCSCGTFAVKVCSRGLLRVFTDNLDFVRMYTPIKMETHNHKAYLGHSLATAKSLSAPSSLIDGPKLAYSTYVKGKVRDEPTDSFELISNNINLVARPDTKEHITGLFMPSQSKSFSQLYLLPMPVAWSRRQEYIQHICYTYKVCVWYLHRNALWLCTPETNKEIGIWKDLIPTLRDVYGLPKQFLGDLQSGVQDAQCLYRINKYTEQVRMQVLKNEPQRTLQYSYELRYYYKDFIGWLPYVRTLPLGVYRPLEKSLEVSDEVIRSLRYLIHFKRQYVQALTTLLSSNLDLSIQELTDRFIDQFRDKAKFKVYKNVTHTLSIPRYLSPTYKNTYTTSGTIEHTEYFTHTPNEKPKVYLGGFSL